MCVGRQIHNDEDKIAPTETTYLFVVTEIKFYWKTHQEISFFLYENT